MATNPNKSDASNSNESIYVAVGRLENQSGIDRDHLQQPHLHSIAMALHDLSYRLNEAAKVLKGEALETVQRLRLAIYD